MQRIYPLKIRTKSIILDVNYISHLRNGVGDFNMNLYTMVYKAIFEINIFLYFVGGDYYE